STMRSLVAVAGSSKKKPPTGSDCRRRSAPSCGRFRACQTVSLFSRVRSWLGRLILGPPIAREFAEEIRFHLYEQIDAGMQAGLTLEDARRAAHKDLGRPAGLIREECLDAWGQVLISDVRRDLTSGVRQWRRAPVVSAVALATLTVAIGATVAVFSLVDAW